MEAVEGAYEPCGSGHWRCFGAADIISQMESSRLVVAT